MSCHRLIWQLFPSQLLVSFAALLAFTWYGASTVRAFYFSKTASNLEAQAHLISSPIRGYLENSDSTGLQAFCQKSGVQSKTRITVIAPDGKVLADSDEEPVRMENPDLVNHG